MGTSVIDLTALDLNERGWILADDLASHPRRYRVDVQTLPGGARAIDAGVKAPGGTCPCT